MQWSSKLQQTVVHQGVDVVNTILSKKWLFLRMWTLENINPSIKLAKVYVTLRSKLNINMEIIHAWKENVKSKFFDVQDYPLWKKVSHTLHTHFNNSASKQRTQHSSIRLRWGLINKFRVTYTRNSIMSNIANSKPPNIIDK